MNTLNEEDFTVLFIIILCYIYIYKYIGTILAYLNAYLKRPFSRFRACLVCFPSLSLFLLALQPTLLEVSIDYLCRALVGH